MILLEGGMVLGTNKCRGQIVKSWKKTGSYNASWNYCASPRQMTTIVTVFLTLEPLLQFFWQLLRKD